MATRARLDAELVKRGLFGSREQAAAAIDAGRVLVAGQPARKAATAVTPDTPVTLTDPDRVEWASRGAHKLLGALDAFSDVERFPAPLRVEGRRCLDAGASTGGFTDVLLRRGAREVVAVDVGYGQIVWRLRTDERVRVVDRTNVRNLTAEQIGGPVELVVSDLSFISLLVVLPALHGCVAVEPGRPADLVLLVKPQFEVGRSRVGKGGVVREPELRAEAVATIARAALDRGLRVRGIAESPLPGPAGNVEYLLWLADAAVDDATDPGPALHGDELDREIARHVSPPPTPGSAVR
ncbi:MAG: rRNA (cytidine1920-2-O)/16S rRNA (cytidine1409-2-O)-methyltransferase [Frankiaceae bacterium]|nr:rRNA (cytidine1920-2-O)/16S rRNA (cytidine1409-2-O)-methyltransferase [Frankiaceae bacterium]